jgi:hypothetical protein
VPTAQTNLDLAAAGAAIVHRLKGSWHGTAGMCLCPCHDDRIPSLSVRVGERSLLLKCFAGCNTIDILRALRSRRFDVPTARPGARGTAHHDASGAIGTRVRDIWGGSSPILGGPADRYLRDRGLAARPADLRYNARTPLGRGRLVTFRPAIIAAVREAGRLVAIQRLFLGPEGTGLATTTLEKAKLTLGRPRGGAVQLAPEGPILGIAEGVETAMAATFLLGIPVWAALGSERLHQIRVPGIVRRLVLLPDNDRAGRIALRRADAAYAEMPFELAHLWPWAGLNDWSDVLNRSDPWEGREGWVGCGRQLDRQASPHPE